MSYNQDIIDFMNGTNNNKNKKKKKINNNYKNVNENKKYQKNEEDEEEEEIDDNDNNNYESDENHNKVLNEGVSNVIPTIPLTTIIPSTTRSNLNQTKLIKSFYDTVIAWIDIDQEQIYSILQSMNHIQQRIYHTNQFVESFIIEPNMLSTTTTTTTVKWNDHGYRQYCCSNTSLLNHNDIQITIQYNIQHQERIMVQLRHCMSELSNMTNRMSRRYEGLYHHYYCWYDGYSSNMSDAIITVDECQILYTAFAKELYRKQILITRMVDTPTALSTLYDSDDIILTNNDSDDFKTEEDGSTRIVRQCIKEWPYTSQQSYLYPYQQLVKERIEQ